MNSQFVDGGFLDESTWLTSFESKISKSLVMRKNSKFWAFGFVF